MLIPALRQRLFSNVIEYLQVEEVMHILKKELESAYFAHHMKDALSE